MKKLAVMIATFLFMGSLLVGTTTVMAAEYKTPAEAVAGITGRTVDSVITERKETGKTFGTMAAEAGKLDEFQQAILSMHSTRLESRVQSGQITQEQAQQIISNIQQNQVVCDGSGNCGYCQHGNHNGNHNGWHQNQGNGANQQNAGGAVGQGQGYWQQGEVPAWCPTPEQAGQHQGQGAHQGGQGWNNNGAQNQQQAAQLQEAVEQINQTQQENQGQAWGGNNGAHHNGGGHNGGGHHR